MALEFAGFFHTFQAVKNKISGYSIVVFTTFISTWLIDNLNLILSGYDFGSNILLEIVVTLLTISVQYVKYIDLVAVPTILTFDLIPQTQSTCTTFMPWIILGYTLLKKRYILFAIEYVFFYVASYVDGKYSFKYFSSVLLLSIITIGIVAIVRMYDDRIVRIENKHEEDLEFLSKQISGYIHEQSLGELSAAIISLRAILEQGSGTEQLDEKLATILHNAERSARTLRSLIRAVPKPEEIRRLSSVIEPLKAQLATRSITLEVEIAPELHTMSPVNMLLVQTIHELLTNAYKYAPEGSSCQLEIELTEHALSFVQTNAIDSRAAKSGAVESLSGGLGLKLLSSNIEEAGGEFSYGKVADNWVCMGMMKIDD